MTTRRDALTFLGLVGASSVALATEGMTDTRPGTLPVGNQASTAKIANALRKLADGIDAGEVEMFSLSVSSELRPNTILSQELRISFALPQEA